MNLEFVPVKNQKFEWGRTINPFNCDCKKCDFMNCPKHNYAVKMTRKKYKVSDFWNEWKDKILELNKPQRWQYSFHGKYTFKMTWEMINDFFDFLCFSFPKGTYWSPSSPEIWDGDIEDCVYQEISLIKLSRSGNEITLGNIDIGRHYIIDYDLSDRQYALAEKIAKELKWLKEKMFEYYQERDKDWKIGWLSLDGRHYPCNHCEHITLAHHLGGGELTLESEGWVKVALHEDFGYFQHYRPGLSAEQRNWLSLNGYVVED